MPQSNQNPKAHPPKAQAYDHILEAKQFTAFMLSKCTPDQVEEVVTYIRKESIRWVEFKLQDAEAKASKLNRVKNKLTQNV